MKRFVVASLCLCVFVVSAFSAEPRDELLKRVPGNVGFVVIIRDVRGQWQKIAASPLASKFLNSPAAKELEKVDRLVQSEIGTTAAKLRDDILGDAVIFLYRPGPPDKPDEDESLILLHVRDPDLAAQIFRHVDEAQQKSGQLTDKKECRLGGKTYWQRKRKDEPDEFQYQRGQFLAFGSGEKLLRRVMELDAAPPAAATVAERLRDRALDAAIVWWINPRAFDAVIEAHRKNAVGTPSVVLGAFARHWQALDGIALALETEREAELRITCIARPDALPVPVRMLLAEAAKPSDLLTSIPADALIRITGRLSLPALVDTGIDFIPESARMELRTAAKKTLGAVIGQDALAMLPERLGPDWAVWVTAPPASAKHAIPELTAAVRLTESADGPPVVQRVLDGLTTLASFAAIAHNSKNQEPITLHAEQQGDVTVKYLAGESLPAGLKPAYAWKGGFLLVASSPDAVRRFRPPPPTPPNAPTREAPVVRVALQGWAKYFRDHRQAVAAFLAKQENISPDEAGQRIDAALAALELFESVEVTVRTAPGRADVGLRVRPANYK